MCRNSLYTFYKLMQPKRSVMLAEFIGQNGSCGFMHNKAYALISHLNPKTALITISSINTPRVQKCPYQSVEAFLKNWKVYKVIPLNEFVETDV